MQSVGRKLAFVLASSNHGTMIVNRLDYRMVDQTRGYGVGYSAFYFVLRTNADHLEKFANAHVEIVWIHAVVLI